MPPAYDLLNTRIVYLEDSVELALMLSGKKKIILLQDFVDFTYVL